MGEPALLGLDDAADQDCDGGRAVPLQADEECGHGAGSQSYRHRHPRPAGDAPGEAIDDQHVGQRVVDLHDLQGPGRAEAAWGLLGGWLCCEERQFGRTVLLDELRDRVAGWRGQPEASTTTLGLLVALQDRMGAMTLVGKPRLDDFGSDRLKGGQ